MAANIERPPLLTSEKELRLESPSAQHVSLSEYSLLPFSCLLGLTPSVLCPASNYIQPCIDLQTHSGFNPQLSLIGYGEGEEKPCLILGLQITGNHILKTLTNKHEKGIGTVYYAIYVHLTLLAHQWTYCAVEMSENSKKQNKKKQQQVNKKTHLACIHSSNTGISKLLTLLHHFLIKTTFIIAL